MKSKAHVVRVASAGVVLFLGLFTVPQGRDVAYAASEKATLPCEVSEGRNVTQAEKDANRGSHTIFGEVTSVDGMTYMVKDESGKEVKLQTDDRTEKSPIKQGDHISASVDNQNHALWIRANRGTDRRTEHVAGGCDPS
jgi:hypothetical protein